MLARHYFGVVSVVKIFKINRLGTKTRRFIKSMYLNEERSIMKKLIIIFLLILSGITLAQGKELAKDELRKLTVEEKLEVAVSNSMSYMIMGISYAKSLGKTPEEFAEHSAKMVIPAYQFMKGRKPFEMIDIINRVQQTDNYFVMEINESTGSIVRGRMTLFGINNIKAARGIGRVTEDDCYKFYNRFVQTLSEGVGFNYQFNVKEDWIEFTLSKI